MQDTRLRRAICRAYNVFAADQFRGLEDRVIPAAIIPMYTPEEAIEEIEFASKQLGLQGDHGGRPHAPAHPRSRRDESGRRPASSSGTT
jgi:predicted TIM-barrel fold metal-dependent hydrolase